MGSSAQIRSYMHGNFGPNLTIGIKLRLSMKHEKYQMTRFLSADKIGSRDLGFICHKAGIGASGD